ncbi:MAG: hypothetical protein Q8N81_02395 [bacterium]|nr:hypothetical protein [bacterium]
MIRFNIKNSFKTLAIAGLLAIASLGVFASVQATGPVFDVFPIGYAGAQNEDYPFIDGRNVTAGGTFSTSQSDHNDGVAASTGDTVEFIIYYHNGAPDDAANTANNVKVRAVFPGGVSNTHSVSAVLTADNASTVYSSSRGGDIAIKVNGSSQTLEYISGSTQWFPNRSTSGQALSDGILSSSGVMLGSIRGCWNYSGFVKFRARVGQTTASGNLQIDKTVSLSSGTSYYNSVDAQPSDIVRFRVVTKALNANVSSVTVRDILPSSLIYRSGTTKVNGATVSDSSGFFGAGYEYGTLSKDQTIDITFEAQLASASYFGNSSQTITNTANARGSGVDTVQDTAEVRVGTVAGSSFELSKSAYNQTQGVNALSVLANAGDIINYKLTYRNSGAATIYSAVIEDDISDVLNHATVINAGEGSLSGNFIRFPAITVPAGVSIDKTFQVRMKDVYSGQTDITMSNTYGNRLDIQIRTPTVLGTYIAPKTGPGENLVLLFAVASTVGVFLYRKYPKFALHKS